MLWEIEDAGGGNMVATANLGPIPTGRPRCIVVSDDCVTIRACKAEEWLLDEDETLIMAVFGRLDGEVLEASAILNHLSDDELGGLVRMLGVFAQFTEKDDSRLVRT